MFQFKSTFFNSRRESRLTLSRREDYGIPDYRLKSASMSLSRFSEIFCYQLPYSGEPYIRGAPRSRDIHPQSWKIRDALQQIDPVNRAVRRMYTIQSCIYDTHNHLRHVESNHKLILADLSIIRYSIFLSSS